jgi:hypothetical protein
MRYPFWARGSSIFHFLIFGIWDSQYKGKITTKLEDKKLTTKSTVGSINWCDDISMFIFF